MSVIGLTGGIASGKSLAAERLSELGAHSINGDLLGHQSYAPGTRGFDNVVSEFGDEVVGDNGEIDRAVLCLLYTSPSPRDLSTSRMPSSA